LNGNALEAHFASERHAATGADPRKKDVSDVFQKVPGTSVDNGWHQVDAYRLSRDIARLAWEPKTKRYERLASQIGDLIRRGDLPPGTRIPAVRAACDAYGVSPSTVFRAYYLLESQGLIVARPRSGYFVSAAAPGAPLHGASLDAE
jgi:hypothetical protein